MGTFWKCVLVKFVLTKFVLTKDLVYCNLISFLYYKDMIRKAFFTMATLLMLLLENVHTYPEKLKKVPGNEIGLLCNFKIKFASLWSVSVLCRFIWHRKNVHSKSSNYHDITTTSAKRHSVYIRVVSFDHLFPLLILHLIFKKSSLKNPVWWIVFLVYFELDFYCLCSLQ